ncbi:saccharopine dehydrogenase [Streptomyces sp. NPDC006553]|uniref:saccharopine dehydrogenase n=1 Tax=unclassified Streptomyces TaxID=2593676 RepID=UPI00224E43E2|nr:saccharopine dehydrogenase [Streptomyces sp. NBC_00233]MCX5232542.1 saccharopine dehydrogenase [Streptomyces sp. NBC_00233]
MPDTPSLWMRHETRPDERRAPLTPEDARRLVSRGIELTVEESPQRIFPLDEYSAVGCGTAPQGSWADRCPAEGYVLGIKELPPEPRLLRHRHIYFGHAYKGQAGARGLLRRFTAGGGSLLDLESLVDGEGRRVAAFGYWAGYAGAALAVLHRRGVLASPLTSGSRGEWERRLRAPRRRRRERVVVIGAYGRCGQGACAALLTAGIEPIRWNSAETEALDRDALLSQDILVNTVGIDCPVPPFLTERDLDAPHRQLSTVCDVTCDVGTDRNALPIYDHVTDWHRPAERLRGKPRPLDLIAIDNLPSLVPDEASRAFSADLWPHLLALKEGSPVWDRCSEVFRAAVAADG